MIWSENFQTFKEQWGVTTQDMTARPRKSALRSRNTTGQHKVGVSCQVQTYASCVALADKIDSLVGIFGIKQPPTGSRDPFALRRQSLGVVRICIENKLALCLDDCLSEAASLYDKDFDPASLSDYIVERLTSYYQEQSIPGMWLKQQQTGPVTLLICWR